MLSKFICPAATKAVRSAERRNVSSPLANDLRFARRRIIPKLPKRWPTQPTTSASIPTPTMCGILRPTSPIHPAASPQVSPRRFKIYFQDDAVCKRSRDATQKLLSSAMDKSPAAAMSNSALLAKKALRYRKVYERMVGVDVNAPDFDASAFLGIAWCKTSNLKAHCQRQSE